MIVELVLLRPVGAHVTMGRLHQDLKVGHRLKVLQLLLGREEASVGWQCPTGGLGEGLGALDRHAEAVEHNVCVAVLGAERPLGDLEARRDLHGAVDPCDL